MGLTITTPGLKKDPTTHLGERLPVVALHAVSHAPVGRAEAGLQQVGHVAVPGGGGGGGGG